ncbi:hypothetical protein PR048_029839 [Dryococelus australis]|uniref:Uncharacterized protein n=1 Tax=Dryococelus australis TaxID=614101 RepID=A0ABQ9G7S7_9NEOP|nr:hypothetical protein PR048_029839 [Dryococelus australis]
MGMAPPDIRHRSIAEDEKMKQENDQRYPMLGYIPQRLRLRSLQAHQGGAHCWLLSYLCHMEGPEWTGVTLLATNFVSAESIKTLNIFWYVSTSRIHAQWKICMQQMA